jgi:hypothetical protein
MSYDYDYVDIYWDEGIFTISIGSNTYSYDIDGADSYLLEGALDNSVPYQEHGEQTTDDYTNYDESEDDYYEGY